MQLAKQIKNVASLITKTIFATCNATKCCVADKLQATKPARKIENGKKTTLAVYMYTVFVG